MAVASIGARLDSCGSYSDVRFAFRSALSCFFCFFAISLSRFLNVCLFRFAIWTPSFPVPRKLPGLSTGRECTKSDRVFQSSGSTGMTQPAERLSLNLASSFARNAEVLPHLFQCIISLLADTEAHP